MTCLASCVASICNTQKIIPVKKKKKIDILGKVLNSFLPQKP